MGFGNLTYVTVMMQELFTECSGALLLRYSRPAPNPQTRLE